jgi:preprotein translocase subunit SecB
MTACPTPTYFKLKSQNIYIKTMSYRQHASPHLFKLSRFNSVAPFQLTVVSYNVNKLY